MAESTMFLTQGIFLAHVCHFPKDTSLNIHFKNTPNWENQIQNPFSNCIHYLKIIMH